MTADGKGRRCKTCDKKRNGRSRLEVSAARLNREAEMAESNLNRRLRDKLDALVWWRIENSAKVGTPDVYCVPDQGSSCWIELKQIDVYPKRASTSIRFKRFTDEQVGALLRLHESGAASFLLVQVEGDHYLFGARAAAEVRDGRDREWWEENAFGFWPKRLDYSELLECLACN
jgi:hypothetical protein